MTPQQKYLRKALILEPVAIPKIGNRYHTSWSKSPYMTWTLVALYPDGTCLLGSKIARFETRTADLRTSRIVSKHTPRKAKQLELAFMNRLELR